MSDRRKHKDSKHEAILIEAEAHGIRIEMKTNGHYRLMGRCGQSACTASCGSTPSDHRAVKNFGAAVRRMIRCCG